MARDTQLSEQPRNAVSIDLDNDTLQKISGKLEDGTATRKLAIVIRASEAMAVENRGGTEELLDSQFYLGVSDLCRDVLREIEELQQIAKTHTAFVMLADDAKGE